MRFLPEYAIETQALLDDNGIEHGAAEFAEGSELAIEAVHVVAGVFPAAGGTGTVVTFASAYKTFVHRHDGKHVSMRRDGFIGVHRLSQRRTEEIIEN